MDSIGEATAAEAYRDAAFIKALLGELVEAHELCERSLALYKKLDDPAGEGEALGMLGTISGLAGRTTEARECFDLALAAAEEHGLDELRYKVLHDLGEFEHEHGSDARAAQLLMESIELSRLAGDDLQTTIALSGLGDLLLDQGDLGAAEERHAEALALFRELGPRRASLPDEQGICSSGCGSIRQARRARRPRGGCCRGRCQGATHGPSHCEKDGQNVNRALHAEPLISIKKT